MLIVADAAMPRLQEFFSELGTIRALPGREINAANVRDAEVLLVRSVTRVDEPLIKDSGLRFVGSATAGCDHVDQSALQRAGIGFAHAPGCNADAVADYVMTASMHLLDFDAALLRGMRVGVIGCGACGSRVRDRFRALGAEVLVCDPPRARAGMDQQDYVDMDAIYGCQLITAHVPLIRKGPDTTIRLVDVDRLRPGTMLINAARGEVLDGASLCRRLECDADLRVVLDVWPGEPEPDPQLALLVELATPHIAGYSLDGKWRGTAMLFDALCRHFGIPEVHPEAAAIETPAPQSCTPADGLREILRQAYDISLDDGNLRSVLAGPRSGHGRGFDALRRQYRERRDFAAREVKFPAGMESVSSVLAAMGFPQARQG